MNQYVQIFLCAVALAIIAWALFSEWRARTFEARLRLCEQKDRDDQITKRIHDLSDPELDGELDDIDGRGKHSA